jgi:hypothetical protein
MTKILSDKTRETGSRPETPTNPRPTFGDRAATTWHYYGLRTKKDAAAG